MAVDGTEKKKKKKKSAEATPVDTPAHEDAMEVDVEGELLNTMFTIIYSCLF